MSYNNSEDYFESNEFKATLKKFEEAERSGQEIILDSEEFVDIAEYYYNHGKVNAAIEIIQELPLRFYLKREWHFWITMTLIKPIYTQT